MYWGSILSHGIVIQGIKIAPLYITSSIYLSVMSWNCKSFCCNFWHYDNLDDAPAKQFRRYAHQLPCELLQYDFDIFTLGPYSYNKILAQNKFFLNTFLRSCNTKHASLGIVCWEVLMVPGTHVPGTAKRQIGGETRTRQRSVDLSLVVWAHKKMLK